MNKLPYESDAYVSISAEISSRKLHTRAAASDELSIEGRIFYDVFYDLCMEYLDDGEDLELAKADSSPAVANSRTTHFAFLDLPKTLRV